MILIHPLASEDVAVVAAMRQATSAHKGAPLGPEARPMFDAMMAATPVAAGVRVEPATVGGIPGVWLRLDQAVPMARVLHLHGGGYVLGSAQAAIGLASQIATRAGADTFVVDYRLAPEHPFPAAIDDVVAAYRGLVDGGANRIVVTGDSAGGGLALALLSRLADERAKGTLQPAGAALMSPWVDLALTGNTFEIRAEADPIFTKDVIKRFADTYLNGADAMDPKASPLYGDLRHLPPIRIDVGDDEVLLDDSIRLADRAQAVGTEVTLSIWTGMPHVFQASVGHLVAAEQSLAAIAVFLRNQLA